jgi:FkbM family methyltransferase
MTLATTGLAALLGPEWRGDVGSRRSRIAQRLAGHSRLLLFGAGFLGRHVLRDLNGLPYTAEAFVDNNSALWGGVIDGLQVLSPQDAAARFGQSALWLITVYTNATVIEQCESLGVPWITCAELSWALAEPHPPTFHFGTPEGLAGAEQEITSAALLWADDESRTEYLAQVRWRFLLDYSALRPPRPTAETYFPSDLVRPLDDEVFVDCGAFTGDTIEAFIQTRAGRFKEIVAIEPDPVNAQALQERIAAWNARGIGPVHVEPVAAGSRRDTLCFSATGTAGSCVGQGPDTVQVLPLDDALGGRSTTYIKFDVEGAERDALLGVANTIRSHQPVLAVCLYHKPEDLWDLPLLIRTLGSDYKMYLRRYSDERWETVCYAVPADRVRS